MKTLIMLIFLQISTPTYDFKSTSTYKLPTNRYEMSQETLNNTNNGNYKPGPKKVSGIDGWAWWILWGSSHNVPSDASNEELFSYYDYVQAGGTLSYQDWMNSQSVPIGSPLCLILISGTYILVKKLRKSETNDLL